MKCFVALEEAVLDELWRRDPRLVMPFSRPFLSSPPNPFQLSLELEAKTLLLEESPAKRKEIGKEKWDGKGKTAKGGEEDLSLAPSQ